MICNIVWKIGKQTPLKRFYIEICGRVKSRVFRCLLKQSCRFNDISSTFYRRFR